MTRIKLAAMMMFGAVLLATVGCGGGVETSSTSDGVGGGSTSSTAPGGDTGGAGGGEDVTTSSSASTGAGPDLDTIGSVDCVNNGKAGKWTPIAPIYGEVQTAMGDLIYQTGALAARRIDPPVYPWTAEGITYPMAVLQNLCVLGDHEVVVFLGAAGEAPAITPADPQVIPVKLGVDLLPAKGGGLANVTFPTPVTVPAGMALWVGIRLVAQDGTHRGCARACDGGGEDTPSYFSATDPATGLSYQCPSESCSMLPLAVSPDEIAGPFYGNNNRRFVIQVHGHPAITS